MSNNEKLLKELEKAFGSTEMLGMATFMQILLEAGESDNPLQAMKEKQDDFKDFAFRALIKHVEEAHMHMPYAFVTDIKAGCGHHTRYMFVMATSELQWNMALKAINDLAAKKPIPAKRKNDEHLMDPEVD